MIAIICILSWDLTGMGKGPVSLCHPSHTQSVDLTTDQCFNLVEEQLHVSERGVAGVGHHIWKKL